MLVLVKSCDHRMGFGDFAVICICMTLISFHFLSWCYTAWWALCSQTFSCKVIDSHRESHMPACRHMYNKHRNPHMHPLHLWEAPGPHACWEVVSRVSERGNSVTARTGRKALFNREKWEAGEELAVAAGIIDGNCLGTRLRFMGRTTRGGWKPGCTGVMKNIKQHCDWPADLTDIVSSQMLCKKERILFTLRMGARMDSQLNPNHGREGERDWMGWRKW